MHFSFFSCAYVSNIRCSNIHTVRGAPAPQPFPDPILGDQVAARCAPSTFQLPAIRFSGIKYYLNKFISNSECFFDLCIVNSSIPRNYSCQSPSYAFNQ